MTEADILKTINSVKDIKGRIRYNNLPLTLDVNISFLYQDCHILEFKDIIDSFDKGNRRVNKCLHDNCDNFQSWDRNQKRFRPYCCKKCANSDPKKDATTIRNNMEKYGVPRASMTEESKAKLLETNMEKFGFKSSAMHPDTKGKALVTNLEKYGHVATEVGNIINLDKYNDPEFIKEHFIKNGMFLKDEFMQFFNCSQMAAHNTLNRLKIDYNKFSSLTDSSIERDIKVFLNENNIKFVQHYRIGLELDFFLPDYNLGIELDGLYYHSYGVKNPTNKNIDYFKTRHITKFNLFKEKGIKVINIWENEVKDLNLFSIWKNRILSYIGLQTNILDFNLVTYSIEDSIEVEQFRLKNSFVYNETVEKEFYLTVRLQNRIISVCVFKILNNNLTIHDIIVGSEYNIKYLEISILSLLIKSYNLNIFYRLQNRLNILDFKNTNSIPDYYIVKGLETRTNTNYTEETMGSDYRLEVVYDFNLDIFENIINNNLRIIWDSGSEIIKLKEIM